MFVRMRVVTDIKAFTATVVFVFYAGGVGEGRPPASSDCPSAARLAVTPAPAQPTHQINQTSAYCTLHYIHFTHLSRKEWAAIRGPLAGVTVLSESELTE